MGKWVAAAGVAVLAILFVLWRQIDASDATAAPPTPASESVARASAPLGAPSAARAKVVEPAPGEDVADEAPSDEPPPVAKMDVESDEFFYKFQEVVPAVLTRNAVRCYEGIAKRVHRNQKLVLKFKIRIKDGVVTVHDVVVDTNTLDNPGLESCFIQEVARSTWTDPALPDWEAEDELVIRPERGMRKYMRANREYVGAEAPAD